MSSCIRAYLGHEVLLLLVQHTHLQGTCKEVMQNKARMPEFKKDGKYFVE